MSGSRRRHLAFVKRILSDHPHMAVRYVEIASLIFTSTIIASRMSYPGSAALQHHH